MTATRRPVLGVLPALLLTAGYAVVSAVPSHADPAPHRVKYAITAANPTHADIYYLDNEPPDFAAYSHNPYQFVPNIQADIGPGKPWVFELMLDQPDQWALATASSGVSQTKPMFHCDLSVDGVVVVSKDGSNGVLCSLRHW